MKSWGKDTIPGRPPIETAPGNAPANGLATRPEIETLPGDPRTYRFIMERLRLKSLGFRGFRGLGA